MASWLNDVSRGFGKLTDSQRSARRRPARTRLQMEALEDRVTPVGGFTYSVNSLMDTNLPDAVLTLREAVAVANGALLMEELTSQERDQITAGDLPNLIQFHPSLFADSDDHAITLTSAEGGPFGPAALTVAADITIEGPSGESGLTIKRDLTNVNHFRLFTVHAGASLTLKSLTLSGGSAVGGNGGGTEGGGGGGGLGAGGAFYNAGSLTISNSLLRDNVATGGRGAGNSFDGNFNGGAGGDMTGSANGSTPGGSNGGAGGSTDGSFTGGAGVAGGYGGGGGGGGVAFAVGGAGGFGGGGGGGQGDGPELDSVAPGGVGGFGGGNGGVGLPFFPGSAGGGGGAGLGGAVFSADGSTLSIVNSTLAFNSATGGEGGRFVTDASMNGFGGSGFGGAVFAFSKDRATAVTIVSSTLFANVVNGGLGGPAVEYAHGEGGAVYLLNDGTASSLTASLDNSILAGSDNGLTGGDQEDKTDFWGGLINSAVPNGPSADRTLGGANNLIVSNGLADIDADFPAAGIVSTDAPDLARIEDNGGPTATFALNDGSPAIDAGSATSALTTDQRGGGFARRSGAKVDIGAFEVQAAPLPAGPYVVSNSTDENDGDYTPGDLSLREAIFLANNHVGPDTITFDGELAGTTFKLTMGQLELTETGEENKTTITGPDAGVTISGDDGTRVFRVPAGVHATLSGLTITRGFVDKAVGGGIESNGTLSLDRVSIVGNNVTAGGGGGIAAGGVLTITNSTISGNTASSNGGGLSFGGSQLTLTNVTVSGNSTSRAGGGLSLSGKSGSQTALFTNVTITGNISDSTANDDGQGGGLIRFGAIAITLKNSIVAGNSRGTGEADDINGAVSADFSLFGTTGGATITGMDNLTGDALLGPLAENGGPTKTHALLAGSPALNAGDDTTAGALTTDQRGVGFARFIGQVDIGAFEVQAPPLPAGPYVVSTLADEDDGDYSDGDLSLREAVLLANSVAGSQSITFDTTLFATPQTISLTLGQLALTETGEENKLTITGPALGVTVQRLATADEFRIFRVSEAAHADLSRLTIRGGASFDGEGGGGLLNEGTLTLTDSTVSGNKANSGGGITSFDTLTLTRVTVSGNSVAGVGFAAGGGIVSFGMLTMVNSTVSGNTAEFSAGGLNLSGTVVITNSTITDNVADADNGGPGAGVGGGFVASGKGGFVTIVNTIVAGNWIGSAKTVAEDISGPVLANFSLVGTDASVTFREGSGDNLTNIDALFSALGDFGGSTKTHALLPGSPAINAGTATGAPTMDQRGVARFAATDLGAFESRGFTLTRVSGDGQTATVGKAFAAPLVVSLAANDASEPVQGGKVTFSVGTMGAGINPNPVVVSVGADGKASATVTANGTAGAFALTASAIGTNYGKFELTNKSALPGGSVLSTAIDDGTRQRSMVRSITLTFESATTAAQLPEVLSKLSLTREVSFGSVTGTLTLAGSLLSSTMLKLTFSGSSVVGGSLADGRYLLKYGDDTVTRTHRLFGDLDGDARVSTNANPPGMGGINEEAAMGAIANNTRRGFSPSYNAYLDYNSNGVIGLDDRDQFNTRKGQALPPLA